MNVLVIAAHPDDEVLGCGGTIARLAREGAYVYTAIVGEGVTSRVEAPTDPRAELEALHAQARAVGEYLGVEDVFLFGLPDNRLDTVPLLDVIHRIEELVTKLRPEVVFTQHGGDLNIDHAQVYRATLTATRPQAGSFVREVLAYEVGSSTEWAFARFSPVFTPSVYYDITSTIDDKVAAMQMYEGEARPAPHPRAPETLRAVARRHGSAAGFKAAEAFEPVRLLR